jgi:transposase
MTLEEWPDCTGIKEGYYNRENLCNWLKESLLPALDRVYGRPIVIILDKCSTIDEVREIVQTAGHILHYLPPYSPDYNPIELTFSVLKAWIKRYYHYMRLAYDNFGTFLAAAIEGSRSMRSFCTATIPTRCRWYIYIDLLLRISTTEQFK